MQGGVVIKGVKLRVFKSFVSTIFIFIIAILIIPPVLYAGSDNEIFLSMAEDIISPLRPKNLKFVGNMLSWNAPTKNIDGTPLEDLQVITFILEQNQRNTQPHMMLRM